MIYSFLTWRGTVSMHIPSGKLSCGKPCQLTLHIMCPNINSVYIAYVFTS